MPYATDSDLTTRHAAALAVSLALRTVALADAAAEIDADAFGGMAVKGHCLLAMHELASDGHVPAGAPGLVVSHSAGEISASYAAPAPEIIGPHASTSYGRRFDALAAKVQHFPEAV